MENGDRNGMENECRNGMVNGGRNGMENGGRKCIRNRIYKRRVGQVGLVLADTLSIPTSEQKNRKKLNKKRG